MPDLVIRIDGQVDNFVDALKQVNDSTGALSADLVTLAEGAAAAFVALTAAIGSSVAKYAESEEASKRLTLALQNQGLYSKDLVEKYQDQAEVLQRLTGIDGDSIIRAQAKIQSMLGQVEISEDLTKAMVDLSIQTGSVESAAEIMGKAIDGNTRVLKQFGITLDENLTKEEATAQLITKVEQKFGGLAETANSGLGSFKGLRAAFDDLAKSVGEAFAPAVTEGMQALTEFFNFLNSKRDHPARLVTELDKLDDSIARLQKRIEITQGGEDIGVPGLGKKAEENVKKMQAELDKLIEKRQKLAVHGGGNKGEIVQDEQRAKNAKRQAAIENEEQTNRRKAFHDHLEAMKDDLDNHSIEVIELLKKQAELEKQLGEHKQQEEKDLIQQHLAVIKRDLEDAHREELEENQTFNEEILAKDEYYQNLRLEERQKFIEQNRSVLLAGIDTEEKARQKAALNEAKTRIKNHNDQLQDEIKFGKAYAAINAGMHSEIYQGTKQAFGQMAEMTQSHNATLKAIGKAATIANIIIKTAESAMAIYAGFSTIPIIGPELGLAGAAAAVAFGAEKVQEVSAAAEGGIMTGGIPGVDSIPTLTMPGELVVPTKNFDEVINAVADQRAGVGPGGQTAVMIGFDGNEAERVITVRQNKSRALGTYLGVK